MTQATIVRWVMLTWFALPLYARDPLTGAAVWTRVVRPSPVTPSFAGFGLFNGAVGFANDRFFAALYDFTPPIVGPPKHLQAFSAVDGSMAWEDEIGPSWSGVGIANGLVIMGARRLESLRLRRRNRRAVEHACPAIEHDLGAGDRRRHNLRRIRDRRGGRRGGVRLTLNEPMRSAQRNSRRPAKLG